MGSRQLPFLLCVALISDLPRSLGILSPPFSTAPTPMLRESIPWHSRARVKAEAFT